MRGTLVETPPQKTKKRKETATSRRTAVPCRSLLPPTRAGILKPAQTALSNIFRRMFHLGGARAGAGGARMRLHIHPRAPPATSLSVPSNLFEEVANK